MSTTHQADPAAPAGLIKSITDEEPVLAAAGATFLVANIGNLLLADHVVNSVQWSATETALTSMVSAGILFVLGWLVRHLVASPKTVRVLQRELELAKSAAASASTPVVVQVDGKSVAAAVTSSDSSSTDDYVLGMPTTVPSA